MRRLSPRAQPAPNLALLDTRLDTPPGGGGGGDEWDAIADEASSVLREEHRIADHQAKQLARSQSTIIKSRMSLPRPPPPPVPGLRPPPSMPPSPPASPPEEGASAGSSGEGEAGAAASGALAGGNAARAAKLAAMKN